MRTFLSICGTVCIHFCIFKNMLLSIHTYSRRTAFLLLESFVQIYRYAHIYKINVQALIHAQGPYSIPAPSPILDTLKKKTFLCNLTLIVLTHCKLTFSLFALSSVLLIQGCSVSHFFDSVLTNLDSFSLLIGGLTVYILPQ
jgi:hypothetical protein